MARRDSLKGLILSAYDLKSLIDWPEALIEDYLNIIENLVRLADLADGIQGQIDDLNDRIDKIEFDEITTNINITTNGNQIITCNNTTPIMITLQLLPDAADRVYITRTDAKVTVYGNGRDINGSSSIVLNQKQQSRLLTYNSTLDEWRVL